MCVWGGRGGLWGFVASPLKRGSYDIVRGELHAFSHVDGPMGVTFVIKDEWKRNCNRTATPSNRQGRKHS